MCAAFLAFWFCYAVRVAFLVYHVDVIGLISGVSGFAICPQLPSEEQACSTCLSFRFFAVFLLLRETGRLWENWLNAKTTFPPLNDMSCACRWAMINSVKMKTCRGSFHHLWNLDVLKHKQGCPAKGRPPSAMDGHLSVWHADHVT